MQNEPWNVKGRLIEKTEDSRWLVYNVKGVCLVQGEENGVNENFRFRFLKVSAAINSNPQSQKSYSELIYYRLHNSSYFCILFSHVKVKMQV